MNCNEAIEYIHSLEKFGIKPGLERISALCAALGNPQEKIKVIHVAGTNGKGSTSTVISNILLRSGYNVGLYTSPYVTDFRERIMFNGEMIAKDDLAFCVEKVKAAADSLEGIEITEFEFLTAVAFVYYEMMNCDFVVLEVGLGGRFDATNVISSPLVCVIASISFDHINILGDTIEKIAFEKCGIIKESAEVVSYMHQHSDAFAVISETCKEKSCNLTVPDCTELNVNKESIEGTYASYGGIDFLLPLAGEHMVYNTCSAIEAVRAVERKGFDVKKSAYQSGIEASVMPARTELISKNPVILLDGGHNEGCSLALATFLRKHLDGKKIVMVSSMMADKDYRTYLENVAPFASTFIACKADVPRALEARELAAVASEYCKNILCVEEPKNAVKTGKELLADADALVVCGSFYLAGEVRDILRS